MNIEKRWSVNLRIKCILSIKRWKDLKVNTDKSWNKRYNEAFNKEAKDVVKVNKYSKQNLSYIVVLTLQ